jgi:hypothetical protein
MRDPTARGLVDYLVASIQGAEIIVYGALQGNITPAHRISIAVMPARQEHTGLSPLLEDDPRKGPSLLDEP